MNKFFVFLLLFLFLIGCIQEICPSDYVILEDQEGRVRCYQRVYTSQDLSGTMLKILKGEGSNDSNKLAERDCPLACIEAIK